MSTGFQTAVAFSVGHNILFKMNKLSEDVILVILQQLEFTRPDVPAKLVSDFKSTFDIQLAVKRWKKIPVFTMKILGHISDWDTSEDLSMDDRFGAEKRDLHK